MSDYRQLADEVGEQMRRAHGTAPYSAQQITLLASRLRSATITLQVHREIYGRPSHSERRRQMEVLAGALSKVGRLASDHDFRPVFFGIAEEAKLPPSDLTSFLDDAARIEAVLIALVAEPAERQKREATPETHALGHSLPKLYREIYPDGDFGGTAKGSEDRIGPGYTFVRLAAEIVGIDPASLASGQRIYDAMREAPK